MNLYKKSFLIVIIFLASPAFLGAQTVDELKSKIEERNADIKNLELEIQKFQTEIDGLGKEANSLKNTLASLDLSKKKIETNLTLTKRKIENTNLEIRELSLQINDKSERIGDSRRVIAHSLANIAQSDNASLLETLLGSQTLAAAWHSAEELSTLQSNVANRISELKDIRTSLQDNKVKTEQKKAELVTLERDLADQKKILAETVREKNSLLASTKNTEAEYKKMLATAQAQKIAFEKELFLYESALKVAIDPTLIPSARKGILAWPLTKVTITQYFGKTVDARRLYASGTHGGMDFAAPIGTPIRASLSGEVTFVEAVKHRSGCQYGKFVLIRHPNGLTTLYGHLSLVNVVVGDSVRTGEVIGYSGNTGYATGPHLHFGVYSSQGVRVVDASELGSRNCSGIKTVAAPPTAYLDPLMYI